MQATTAKTEVMRAVRNDSIMIQVYVSLALSRLVSAFVCIAVMGAPLRIPSAVFEKCPEQYGRNCDVDEGRQAEPDLCCVENLFI